MRVIRALALAGCALAADARGAEPDLPRRAAWLDAAADRVVARSFVPSAERRVGEVRLIRRGEADVVQTLLYTKVLRRVVGEIRQKELANWPEGPGREDALRYVDALAAVQKQLSGRPSGAAKAQDRRQKLWIEFVLAPRAAAVAIGAFEMEEHGGEVRVLRRETLALLQPSRDYVLRNMRHIAADAFHVEGDALAALLGPLELLRAPEAPAARDRRGPPPQED